MDYDRFRNDVRKKFVFAGNDPDDSYYICPKKLMVKSAWRPGPQDETLELKINNFIQTLDSLHNNHVNHIRKGSNLSILQKSHLHTLHKHKDFVILMCDKNLGPAILERVEYIKMVLKEHLHDTTTYTNLTEEIAHHQLNDMRKKTLKLFVKHAPYLSDFELKYFRTFLLKLPTNIRIPQFYGMPKVHKLKVPTPLRPVIAQCGSFTAYISTWLDTQLQKLTPFLPSYIKDSNELLSTIDILPQLPINAKIATTDATSMYTNISTEEGIKVIKKYLETFGHETGEDLPIDLICALLEIVMTTNIFKFGNSWWKQIDGTAMGTPCACIYSMLYFGYFERTLILPKYKDNILLYKRQIDDIFIVWTPTPNNNTWDNFVHDINTCSSLSWETEPLGNSTHFLDLNIWINTTTRQLHLTSKIFHVQIFFCVLNK